MTEPILLDERLSDANWISELQREKGRATSTLAPTTTVAQARAILRDAMLAYDPNQPRRSDGKWGRGGGSRGRDAGGGVAGSTPEGLAGQDQLMADKVATIEKHGFEYEPGDADSSNAVAADLKGEVMHAVGRTLDDLFPAAELEAAATFLEKANRTTILFPGWTPGERVANEVVHGWAGAAWDPAFKTSMVNQLAIEREFKTGISPFMQSDTDSLAVSRQIDKIDLKTYPDTEGWPMPVVQAAMRTMYVHTQARLSGLGVGPTVTLHRGIKRKDLRGEHPIDLNPASSWAYTDVSADGFADPYGEGGKGSRLTMTVPRERILSMPQTGMGCFEEDEVIILRGDGDRATWEDPDI